MHVRERVEIGWEIMIMSGVALIIGFCIDLIVGDPHSIPHPIAVIGKLISVCEKILRATFPKTKKGEFIAGIVLVMIVLILSTGIPFAILVIAGKVSIWLRLAIESIMCWQILATKSLKYESMKVYQSLASGNMEEARDHVSMIVGRDTEVLDHIGITKAAVETVAENTSDGVVAPMIYLAIGGAWLGFLYKAINTMDSMVAYKNDRYLYFGRAAAHLDDISNYIPSRVSALLMIVVSNLIGLNGQNAFVIWKRDSRKHASPNAAQTEAACAGALGIKLAGDAVYGGKRYKKEYIGDELRTIEYEDIKVANKLMYATATLCIVLIVIIKVSLLYILCNDTLSL